MSQGSSNNQKPVIDLRAMRRNAGRAARLMRALSNPHRLVVLCVLSEGELSVSDLNERIDLSQSALSQHLAVLRNEKLVKTRRESQTIYYSVIPGTALDIVHLVHDQFCCQSPTGDLTGTSNLSAKNKGASQS